MEEVISEPVSAVVKKENEPRKKQKKKPLKIDKRTKAYKAIQKNLKAKKKTVALVPSSVLRPEVVISDSRQTIQEAVEIFASFANFVKNLVKKQAIDEMLENRR